MAAELNELGAEMDVDYVDESDLLMPETDFEDELPIDSWQPSDESDQEARVVVKPKPGQESITPRPPWTIEHDVRTVQRLQLLGPDVVRTMFAELQRSNPTATLATLFAQLENPCAPVWDLDVANKRLGKLMSSGRTANLAFELFPVLQLRINLLAIENLKSLSAPVNYALNENVDLNHGYSQAPGVTPNEPPQPGFRPGAPKM